LAVHGYGHINMKMKKKEEQIEIIRKSYQAFQQFNMPVYGFRCPYLSYNGNTIKALSSSPFTWTSNHVVFWEKNFNLKGFDENYFKRLEKLYQFSYSDQFLSLPRRINRILDIPITAPDDEMLFERYHVRNPRAISDVWLRILTKVYHRGELFHIFFHPERFLYLKDSLQVVATKAQAFDPPIWIASLDEIATWWTEREKSTWRYERLNSGNWRVWLQAPEGATVLMKSEGKPQAGACYKNYAQVKPIAKRNDRIAFSAGQSKRYTIGIAEACSKELEDFLVEEGFLVERSEQPEIHSLYIEGYETFKEEDKLSLLKKIDTSPFPLLRLWRWPNGARSALAISADVDSITLVDFVRRAIHF